MFNLFFLIMQNFKIHTHTCNTCGTTKDVYLSHDETPEDLHGCVCDRTVSKVKFSDNDLMLKVKKD